METAVSPFTVPRSGMTCHTICCQNNRHIADHLHEQTENISLCLTLTRSNAFAVS